MARLQPDWRAWASLVAAVLGSACSPPSNESESQVEAGGSSLGPSGTSESGTSDTVGSGSSEESEATSETGDDGGYPSECGNHLVEPGEACDDGNQVIGDGCNPDCIVSGSVLWKTNTGGAMVLAADGVDGVSSIGWHNGDVRVRKFDDGGEIVASHEPLHAELPSNADFQAAIRLSDGGIVLASAGNDAFSVGDPEWPRFVARLTAEGDTFDWVALDAIPTDDEYPSLALRGENVLCLVRRSEAWDAGGHVEARALDTGELTAIYEYPDERFTGYQLTKTATGLAIAGTFRTGVSYATIRGYEILSSGVFALEFETQETAVPVIAGFSIDSMGWIVGSGDPHERAELRAQTFSDQQRWRRWPFEERAGSNVTIGIHPIGDGDHIIAGFLAPPEQENVYESFVARYGPDGTLRWIQVHSDASWIEAIDVDATSQRIFVATSTAVLALAP